MLNKLINFRIPCCIDYKFLRETYAIYALRIVSIDNDILTFESPNNIMHKIDMRNILYITPQVNKKTKESITINKAIYLKLKCNITLNTKEIYYDYCITEAFSYGLYIVKEKNDKKYLNYNNIASISVILPNNFNYILLYKEDTNESH